MVMHILIISEHFESFEIDHSYTDYVSDLPDVKLMVITSTGHVSENDKKRCLAYAEIDKPCSNGKLELIALDFHKRFRVDRVYTCHEELVMRASYIRHALGLKTGLLPQDAIQFRDKAIMKSVLARNGVPMPKFQKIESPFSILDFTATHGYPVIIKPILGCESQGVRVIHDQAECEAYIEKEFYMNGNDSSLDYTKNQLIEQYIPCTMFHVNGYARDGKLEYVWPFQYMNNNLAFTKGAEYGNISIQSTDEHYHSIIRAIEKILAGLPCGDHLMFHCELFLKDGEFLLCEIAARKPGATITLLMDMMEGGQGTFPEIEFRLSNGLKPRNEPKCRVNVPEDSGCVGDLLIRRPIGLLKKLPNPKECPVKDLKCIPIAQENSVYSGFDVNCINTSMRMIATSKSIDNVRELLQRGSSWYQKNVEVSEYKI